jgi:hypothetical protein
LPRQRSAAGAFEFSGLAVLLACWFREAAVIAVTESVAAVCSPDLLCGIERFR